MFGTKNSRFPEKPAVLYRSISEIIPFSRIVTIAAIGVGALVYLVAVLLVKALDREDVLNLPKGEKIAALMTKYKLL